MADDSLFRAKVLGWMAEAGGGLHVHDGYVDEEIPEDEDGYIEPYALLLAGVGGPLMGEGDLTGLVDTAGLRWDFATTAVGPTASVCVDVARALQGALTNRPLGRSHIVPNPDGFFQQEPLLDNSVTPARFMLPLPWRLETT